MVGSETLAQILLLAFLVSNKNVLFLNTQLLSTREAWNTCDTIMLHHIIGMKLWFDLSQSRDISSF
jgi:hypothetical protein